MRTSGSGGEGGLGTGFCPDCASALTGVTTSSIEKSRATCLSGCRDRIIGIFLSEMMVCAQTVEEDKAQQSRRHSGGGERRGGRPPSRTNQEGCTASSSERPDVPPECRVTAGNSDAPSVECRRIGGRGAAPIAQLLRWRPRAGKDERPDWVETISGDRRLYELCHSRRIDNAWRNTFPGSHCALTRCSRE